MSSTDNPTYPIRHPLWVHSWHCRTPESNVIGVKEKVTLEYEDGHTEQTNNIRYFRDPIRPFYVTKPMFRDHEFKKEFEEIDRCDKYMVHDSQLEEQIELVLRGKVSYNPKFKPNIRQLCDSPYLYGADVDTQTIIRQKYNEQMNLSFIPSMDTGTFDIENDPITKEINLITYSHENIFYTGLLKSYVRVHLGDNKFRDADMDEVMSTINSFPQITNVVKEHNIELNVKICDTEIELIIWIFQQIHKHKTDFVGIWNMNHDIPTVIDRIKANGMDPNDVMIPDDVPNYARYLHYREDTKTVDHLVDKWHWFTLSGYTQFIDDLTLYGRLRKASGRDVSYSLDYISDKEIGIPKLHLGDMTSHKVLQMYRFLEYTAYNLLDCILLFLMNKKNNDKIALHGNTDMSHISRFNTMNALIRDNMYSYGRPLGLIVGSTGSSPLTQLDKDIIEKFGKGGGTVLHPNKGIGVTVPIIDICAHDTQICIYSNDIDVSSQYPSAIKTYNISKETCLAATVAINGYTAEEMELFFSSVIEPYENAVPLCNKFFGLPTLEELGTMYAEEMRHSDMI